MRSNKWTKKRRNRKESKIFKIDNGDYSTVWTTGITFKRSFYHRDDDRIDPQIEPEQNDGNLRALLRFKIKDDKELYHLFQIQNKTIILYTPLKPHKIK